MSNNQSGKKKKFTYNLETILKVREIYKKQQEEKFSLAQTKLQEERRKEKEIKSFQQKKYNELRESIDGGATLNFSDLLLRKTHLEKLAADVKEQEKIRQKAAKRKERERRTLVEKMKDQKVMEKDKHNKLLKWQKNVRKEETKFLDDLSSGQFNARKSND